MKFLDLPLNDDILDALWDMHFDDCTPIQEEAIPGILMGRDLIGVAQTGTGKTAAFLLPVLQRLSEEDFPDDAINCLIMSPTRELALQIDQQLQGFSYYMDINSVAVYGGNDGPEFARQKKGLKMGADIVIATPGRLISHINVGNVDLSRVSFFILDEADRMLDMGFYEDIMKIANELPKSRQTIMFSATMPPKIRKLAGNILSDPLKVELAVSKPADGILQKKCVCYENQKLPVLKQMFERVKPERTLIFASSKLKVKELSKLLRDIGMKVGEMHSDLDQRAREDVIVGFKSGRIPVLVATDIVSRGIDIDDIRLVINFDVPREAEDYVHRIGRTARAGAEGSALTFVNEKEREKFRRIERFLEKEVESMSIDPEFGSVPDYSEIHRDRKTKKGGRKAKQGREMRKPRSSHNSTESNKNKSGDKPKKKRWTHRKKDTKPSPSENN